MADAMISLGAKLKQLAEQLPDAPFVSCGDVTYSYGAFHRITNRAARGLASLGTKAGDMVTLGLPNSNEFAIACWAIWKLGATPQPVSFRLPRLELEAIMELARTPVVIAAFDYDLTRRQVSVADLLSLSDDESDLPDATAPVARATTSGGSTGRPKLILSGEPGLTSEQMPEVSDWRMPRGSIVLLPGPLYHTAGFTMMMSAMTIGGHVVIMPRFEPEATLAAIERHRANYIYLVPTMMNRIWKLPEDVRAKYDLSSIVSLWHLAAPCPAWLKEAFIHWIGPEKIMECYAGSEAQAETVINGAEWLEHRGSVGRVVIGEMKVVDDKGAPAPAGQTGEIYMRRSADGPASYQYVGATARTLPGGWESLGDIGWFDEDGYLYLADRRTDMILVGGSNVYPAEIEAALEEHPAVDSCAVVGLPDDDLGNQLHAIVHAKGDFDEAGLREHLKTRLVTYKQPRTYEFSSEPIRDDAGKVRRTALRDARIAAMKRTEPA